MKAAGAGKRRRPGDAEADKEIRRIARIVAQQSGNDSLAEEICRLTREARTAGMGGALLQTAGGTPVAASQLAALTQARDAVATPAPPGTQFFSVIRWMLHAFGDAVGGDPEVAVVMEKEVVDYTKRIVPVLRQVCNVKHLRISHFASTLPETTRAYFRWRTLKAMAAQKRSDEAAGAAPAAAAECEEEEEGDLVEGGGGSDADEPGAAGGGVNEEQLSDADSDILEVSLAPRGGGGAAEKAGELDDAVLLDPFDLQPAAEPAEGEAAASYGGATADAQPSGFPSSLAPGGLPPGGAAAAAGGGMPLNAAASAAAAALAEEEQEAALVALLQCDAEEELRQQMQGGSGLPGGAAAPGSQGLSPTWRAFLERIAFANRRSKSMTALQYAIYARAREVGFTTYVGSNVTKRFTELVPPPLLTRLSLEVIAYLAYDRVGSIVEAALRRESAVGADSVTLLAASAPLSLAAYTTALRSLPELPLELASVVASRQNASVRAVEIGKMQASRALLETRLQAAGSMAPPPTGGGEAAGSSSAASSSACGGGGSSTDVPSLGALDIMPLAAVAVDAAADAEFLRFISSYSAGAAALLAPAPAAAAAGASRAPQPAPTAPSFSNWRTGSGRYAR